MAYVHLDPDFSDEQFLEDSEALPEGEVRFIEAWPGSVQVDSYVWEDGTQQLFIDGVALRIFGKPPPEAICVCLHLVPPEKVDDYRDMVMPRTHAEMAALAEEGGA